MPCPSTSSSSAAPQATQTPQEGSTKHLGCVWMVPCSWVTMSLQLYQHCHPPSHLLEKTEAPQQGPQCPPCCRNHRPAASPRAQTCTPAVCDNPRTRLPHGILCSSTVTAAPPCRRGGHITLCVYGHHWGKPVHNDEKQNLDFTKEQEGTPMPAPAFREAKFPSPSGVCLQAGGDG